MPVIIKNGDIFQSNMQTLVCPVNCVGVMGKGLALEFKRRHPIMYEDYRYLCREKDIYLTYPCLFRESDLYIIYFPTKYHWKDKSTIRDIDMGMVELYRQYDDWNIRSLAIPALGCGCGELNWKDVLPIIMKYAERMDIPVEIYEPH